MSRTEDLSWSLVIRSYEGKIIGSQKSLAFIGIGESLLCLVQTGNIAAAKGFPPSRQPCFWKWCWTCTSRVWV